MDLHEIALLVWEANLPLFEKADGLAVSLEPGRELVESDEDGHGDAYFSLSTRGSSMTA